MMAFLSVSWAYACIKMVMKLLNTGRNTGVQRLTGNVAVSVNIPVRQQNTAEPCTSLPRIIQVCLTYRQETQKHGKRNTIEELPWNALISLFNNPPRSSNEWKLEYNARTSAECSNKREKLDFKLEDSRHRSTKMWYCRLYGIMMLQHLDAWEMPSVEAFQKSLLGFTA